MKTYALVFAVWIGSTLSMSAQEKNEKSVPVPAETKAAFDKKFPGITAVKWGKEKGDYEANFKSKGTEMSAVFTPKGVLKETEKSIPATQLPANVTSYVQQHYKGRQIKEAAQITDAAGTVTYEAEVNKADLIFDAAGKFVKIAKD